MPRLAVINPYQKFYALDGLTPLSGGSVQFYENLTTTPLSIYSDRNLTTPQTNPYTLDAGGAINGDVFFSSLATMVTYDSIGAEIDTFNYVSCVDLVVPFAPWSATTIYTDTFASGNIVQSTVDNNYYISIATPNLNHEPSVSPLWWEPYGNYLIKIQTLVAAKSVAVGNATTGLTGVAITNGYTVIGNTAAGIAGINTVTKGTIAAGDGTTTTTLAVGTDGQALIADSASAAGLKYASVVVPGMVLIATLTPTAAANVDFLTTFSSTYNNYLIIGDGILPASGSPDLYFRLAVAGSAVTTSSYTYVALGGTASGTATTTSTTTIGGVASGQNGVNFNMFINNVNASTYKRVLSFALSQTAAGDNWASTDASTGFSSGSVVTGGGFYWSGGQNFAAVGTIYVYGYSKV